MKRDFLRAWLMTVVEVAHGEAKRIDSTICWISFLGSRCLLVCRGCDEEARAAHGDDPDPDRVAYIRRQPQRTADTARQV